MCRGYMDFIIFIKIYRKPPMKSAVKPNISGFNSWRVSGTRFLI